MEQEKAARMNGLEIGGKTGTAQIARGGKYLKNIYLHFWFCKWWRKILILLE